MTEHPARSILEFLRQQAAKCFALADEVRDTDARRRLKALGQAFLDKAVDIEAEPGIKH